ncbi:MAG: NAD(P)/FAD-dependent oxidoreductase [Cytophagales bacterium]|nr:NAD(P)/FAD-dependent oxidoreductase [Cytophagales bacterium]
MKKNITIIGAGPVGSLLSIYLIKAGYNVQIFEKRPNFTSHFVAQGRSINIALSTRGWNALEFVNLKNIVSPHALPMYGRMIHDIGGAANFQPYSTNHDAIFAISRNNINQILVNEAINNGVNVHFDCKINDINIHDNIIKYEYEGSPKYHPYEVLFCADGAHSLLAQKFVQHHISNYDIQYLTHSYIEISLPPNNDGSYRLRPDALHIWPGDNFMLIALPNTDYSFTCTLFMPNEGVHSFHNLESGTYIYHFFSTFFKDFVSAVSDIDQNVFFQNIFSQLKFSQLHTSYIYPWCCGNTLLIGDSAHTITPFYGQGMNCGFEDVYQLYLLLEKYNNWYDLFQSFQNLRKPNTDAIAKMAIDNFHEMKFGVADMSYQKHQALKKQIIMESNGIFIPKYESVSFSNIPYVEIYENDKQLENYIKMIQRQT